MPPPYHLLVCIYLLDGFHSPLLISDQGCLSPHSSLLPSIVVNRVIRQVASPRNDQRMPLRKERNCYSTYQPIISLSTLLNISKCIRTPHQITACKRQDQGTAPDTKQAQVSISSRIRNSHRQVASLGGKCRRTLGSPL